MTYAAAIASGALLAWALTALLVRVLGRARHLDIPNDRSMHTQPVPKGGGLAIVAAVIALLPLFLWPVPPMLLALAPPFLAVVLISLLDGFRTIWPGTRLIVHAMAVVVALSLLPDDWRLVPQLPFWLERAGLALAWLWTINLTNFMDGIDGMAGAEVCAVALGYVLILDRLGAGLPPLALLALILAGACLGYLAWNWHPARIFMGDVGSIPLGFLMGLLMLDLVRRGAPAAAVILPLYFFADATITLVKRLVRGEKVWQAHRTHYYQRAVLGGATQPAVVGAVTLANLALAALAVLSLSQPLLAVPLAVAVVVVLLAHLDGMANRAAPV